MRKAYLTRRVFMLPRSLGARCPTDSCHLRDVMGLGSKGVFKVPTRPLRRQITSRARIGAWGRLWSLHWCYQGSGDFGGNYSNRVFRVF